MNLENFPTDETALDMMSMVTPIYGKSYIAKWIYEVMGMEMSDVKRLFEELRLQISYETATWGLKYHEQKYGLEVNEKSDIEKRRSRIRFYLAFRAPANPGRIRVVVEEITGFPTKVVEIGYAQILINIQDDGKEHGFDESFLKDTIRQLRPAHVEFEIKYIKKDERFFDDTYKFDDSILFNAREYGKEE